MLVELFIWPLFLLFVYVFYVFLSAVLLYTFIRPNKQRDTYETDPQIFYGSSEGADKALIIENRPFSLDARINLIENAVSSVKVAYFAITDGIVSDVFYGLILEAADRGVDVQILFDGMGQNLIGEKESVYWALVQHPRIRLRFYEKNHKLTPWRWNNMMHDKILIVDDRYAMTGGRNLEDRFHLVDYDGGTVEDRDVMIVRKKGEPLYCSSISQFILYFNVLWDHPFSRPVNKHVPHKYKAAARQKHTETAERLSELKASGQFGFHQSIDWESQGHPANRITLVSNPITRMKKYPLVLTVLQSLFAQTDQLILAQSPFIVPGKEMQKYFDFSSTRAEVHYLTNSLATSPNVFALSGQMKYTDFLKTKADQIYEYQGEGSIHGKAFVFDDRLSALGSFNLDPRSAFLSTENLVIIDSLELATELKANIQSIISESLPTIPNGPVLAPSILEVKDVPLQKRRWTAFTYAMVYLFEDIL
ncbi:Cardiolipin synthetase [Alkalibacterium sp. AK22]|uniref:phospholipase D-like domain-containing protein n=1 Tax=Alkalibacterium sp. AK22 TaxID=1229520 RepID=UPI0004460FFB|nr:phospholipase D-like domain-containing protein [Alkalibacterium sp. AK22]EXJ22551.1 Cardiolipin synthetase [Alkalibacterium sp. AK22]